MTRLDMLENKMTLRHCSLLTLALHVVACGEDEPRDGQAGDACTLDGESTCEAGLACDPRADGSAYVCGEAVTIRGRVLDALSGDLVSGGRVVVLAADGSPVADVAYTDEVGQYSAVVSAPRNADGSVADTAKWTLAVSAQGYEPFPSGPRPAVPISGSQLGDGLVVEASNTEVGLLPLASPELFNRQISGNIAADAPGGTLVVAAGEQVPARHAIASRSGEFTLFNVPSGASLSLNGYKRGQQLEPIRVDTREGSVSDVVLERSLVPLGSVSGNVNVVNAPGGSLTSVVLVPESVFDTRLERGPIPLGLRAPGLPEAPSISGAFAFDQVPRGNYVVLAAFENDSLVRDPDESIGGTTIQVVTVESGESVAMSQSFKITEHLAIVAPGAQDPERVSGAVTFSWVDDSSEDRYELELYTALGDLVWEQRAILPGRGGANVELPYDGPELLPGMVYQFRVTSFRDRNGVTTAISRSEDLRGVFEYFAE
jgi:hypothetical protein